MEGETPHNRFKWVGYNNIFTNMINYDIISNNFIFCYSFCIKGNGCGVFTQPHQYQKIIWVGFTQPM